MPLPFPHGKKGNAMSSLVVLLLKNYYGHNFLDFSIFQQEKRNRKVNLAIYNSCSVTPPHMTLGKNNQRMERSQHSQCVFSFPPLIVVPLSSHEVDGVRKEKERLTAAIKVHHKLLIMKGHCGPGSRSLLFLRCLYPSQLVVPIVHWIQHWTELTCQGILLP